MHSNISENVGVGVYVVEMHNFKHNNNFSMTTEARGGGFISTEEDVDIRRRE